MQRDERRLHRDRNKEGQDQPPPRHHRQAVRVLNEHAEVERSQLEEEEQHADEQERRAGHGVEEELDGGGGAPLSSPSGDQEVPGEQRGLEEQEEQEKVERHERSQHERLESQDGGPEGAHVV